MRTSEVEQEKHNPSGSCGPTSLYTREALGAVQHSNSSASAKFPALWRCSEAKKQALHNFRAPTRIGSVPGPFRVSGASGRGSHMSGKAHHIPLTPSPGGPGGGLKRPRCPLVTFGQSKVTENARLPKRTSEVEQEKHNPSGSCGPTSLYTREALGAVLSMKPDLCSRVFAAKTGF